MWLRVQAILYGIVIVSATPNGRLEEIRKRYGRKVHIRSSPQNSLVVIVSLDDGFSIEEIKREFSLRTWFELI